MTVASGLWFEMVSDTALFVAIANVHSLSFVYSFITDMSLNILFCFTDL